MERLGGTQVMNSLTKPTPEAQAAELLRARKNLLKAQELGDNSNLLHALLDGIPEDGKRKPFSTRKEVNDAMFEGEMQYAVGDLDKAVEAYKKAFALDPKLYWAPLFIGDMYFKKDKFDDAGEWFARAIKVDPNRETAYRYWGDALVKAGKDDDARDKFIDAVVAEPYNRGAREGLSQWADHVGVKLTAVRWKPTNLGDKTDNESDGAISLAYTLAQAQWQGDKFQKEFPAEKTYRHSLREETDVLSTVADIAKEQGQNGATLSPAVENLIALKKAGLLEPYILLTVPDKGIAQDYAAYRDAHRDKLRQYLNDFVIPKTPKAK